MPSGFFLKKSHLARRLLGHVYSGFALGSPLPVGPEESSKPTNPAFAEFQTPTKSGDLKLAQLYAR
jgi:hypothetical protein